MNSFVKLPLIVGAFCVATLAATAQPALKVFVVDMAKIYDGHYKTAEQNAKLRSDMQKAQVELDRINKEGNALIEQYKEAEEQAQNPALTNEAKAKAERDAQARAEMIQRKEAERDNLTNTVEQTRQEQVNRFREYLFGEISKVATDIAKKKGATLLVDSSGPSLFGLPNFLYADSAYDITDEVTKEVSKDAPSGAAAKQSAPSSTATPANSSPVITVPNAPAKK